MIRGIRGVALALAVGGLFPFSSLGEDVTQARFGNVMFEMPKDWSRRPNEHFTTFGPPAARDGKSYELRLLEGAEEADSPREFMTKAVRGLEDRGQVVQKSELQTADHPDGWNLAAISVVMKNDGQTQYATFFVAKAGKRLQPFLYVSNDAEHWKANLPAVERFVKSLKFANLTVLHPGDKRKSIPPLTLFTVNEEADFLEWLMGVPFTQEQREAFTAMIVDGWKKLDKETVDDVASVLKTAGEFKALPAEKRDAARQAALLEGYLPSWREQVKKDPACKFLVDIYDAANKPIAKGNPPLTRQAADAFLETVYFIAAELEKVPHVPPTADEKKQFADKLAQAYGAIAAEEQQVVAKMPLVWSAVRLTWPEMSADQKAELLKQFGSLAPVKTLRAQLATARQTAEAKTASAPVAPVRGSVTPSTPAKDPVAAMPDDKRAAYLEAMRKMQQQHETYRMISNMSSQMHETRMNIIRNIGGQGTQYRWEYRPVYK